MGVRCRCCGRVFPDRSALARHQRGVFPQQTALARRGYGRLADHLSTLLLRLRALPETETQAPWPRELPAALRAVIVEPAPGQGWAPAWVVERWRATWQDLCRAVAALDGPPVPPLLPPWEDRRFLLTLALLDLLACPLPLSGRLEPPLPAPLRCPVEIPGYPATVVRELPRRVEACLRAFLAELVAGSL